MRTRGFDERMMICAYNAMKPFASIDDPGIQDEIVEMNSPLDILIEKEEEQIKENKYQNLSKEAKQVISMIFNAPAEILDLITTNKNRKINKHKVKKLLSKQLNDSQHAKKVVQEIEDFTKVLTDKGEEAKVKVYRGMVRIRREGGRSLFCDNQIH